jgi:hypothetical protein
MQTLFLHTLDILEAEVLVLTLGLEELVLPTPVTHKRETTQQFQLVEMGLEVTQPAELSLLHTPELLSQGLHTLLHLITARVQMERMAVPTALPILVLLEQA